MAGLACRAGRVMAGSAACEKGLKQKKICLLLVQQGLSEGSLKNFGSLCERFGASMMMIGAEDDLGKAIGRPGVMLVGVTDAGFAKAIQNNYHGGSGIE
jgi:ribosomal protein L7Ae-like RNA K-turn-binding protein